MSNRVNNDRVFSRNKEFNDVVVRSNLVVNNIINAGTSGPDLGIAGTNVGVYLTSTEAAADAILLTASNAAGGIDINAGTAGVTMDATGSLALTSSEAAADAVLLNASNAAGGVTITAGTGNVNLNGYRRSTQVAGTGALVLTAADSGDVVYLDTSGGVPAITLPAVKAGLFFTFVLSASTGGNNATIGTNGGDNVIYGMTVCRDGNAGVPGSAEDLITFVNTSDLPGDFVHLECDGTSWFLHGITDVPAAITMGAT